MRHINNQDTDGGEGNKTPIRAAVKKHGAKIAVAAVLLVIALAILAS